MRCLQQFLGDIRSGKVDVIVAYMVDRLTRSLADFAKLVELFLIDSVIADGHPILVRRRGPLARTCVCNQRVIVCGWSGAPHVSRILSPRAVAGLLSISVACTLGRSWWQQRIRWADRWFPVREQSAPHACQEEGYKHSLQDLRV